MVRIRADFRQHRGFDEVACGAVERVNGRLCIDSPMKVRHLGHLVLYVRDLETSLSFYRDLLGIGQAGSVFGGRAALLSSGRTHHELLLIEVGDAPGPAQGNRLGLYHVGWCIGDTDDELRQAKKQLEAAGVSIEGVSDHVITHSLYVRDPDGNEIELYVDVPDYDWKQDTEWIDDPVRPLDL